MSILKLKEEFYVVKVHTQSNNALQYEYNKVIKNTKGELEYEEEEIGFLNSVKELKKQIKEVPVILCVIGENVLYPSNIALFKSSSENFYTLNYRIEGSEISSLVRKETVDDLVKELLEESIYLLDVYIGFLPFLLLKKEKILLDDIATVFKKKLEENNKILSIALVFNYLFPSGKIDNSFSNESVNKNQIDYPHKLHFDFFKKIGTLAVFILILMFYLLGEFFFNKNQILNNQLNLGENKVQQLERLKQQEKRKLEMLEISGIYKGKLLSFYTNEIMKIMPKTVRLNLFEVFPIKNKIISERKVEFREKMLVIDGFFINNEEFNSWLMEMKKLLSIRKIDIVKFDKQKSETNFKIEISLE